MTPDAFDALLTGLVLGFTLCLALWVLSGRSKAPQDRIREYLLALARAEAANLPEPDDRDVAEMMTDTRLAAKTCSQLAAQIPAQISRGVLAKPPTAAQKRQLPRGTLTQPHRPS